jgi:hypothetical protein
MYTDSEIENILIAGGYSCRHRKRPLKDLGPSYQSKLKRKANEFMALRVSKGVPTKYWNIIKNCKDLVKNMVSIKQFLTGMSPRVLLNW